ncbi:MAG: PH domain-containing protein [Actinobacteria bacterium]|nr:PH domain-containing protein [Actinomycetota bacterium]
MTFAKKNLNPNETVALDMHPHWWYFAGPAATLAAVVVLGIVLAVSTDVSGTGGDILRVLVIALIVLAAIWLIVRYLKWFTTYFVITSHRLIFRTGVLAKSGIEIPLERVNNVNFNQSIFERLLGAGDLLIESGGEDGQSRYTDIRHPDRVQRLIHAQMELAAQRRGSYEAGPTVTTASVTEQLERLEAMMQRGSLSVEEFEEQKRRLLEG